jgi:hypothetical protein
MLGSPISDVSASSSIKDVILPFFVNPLDDFTSSDVILIFAFDLLKYEKIASLTDPFKVSEFRRLRPVDALGSTLPMLPLLLALATFKLDFDRVVDFSLYFVLFIFALS